MYLFIIHITAAVTRLCSGTGLFVFNIYVVFLYGLVYDCCPLLLWDSRGGGGGGGGECVSLVPEAVVSVCGSHLPS